MKTPIAKRVKGAIGHAAGFAGVFARGFRSKMVIVAFHRVNDGMPEDGLTCSSAKFEKFCRFFRTHFRVIPLWEQVAGRDGTQALGGTLSITLDDGYRDNFEVAAPILRKLDLPATFFVTTQGFEIGGHTDTHVDLGTADVRTVQAELEASQRKLREQLGKPGRLFAHPFGGPNNITAQSLQLVREAAFVCSVACFGGVNVAAADPFSLNRITIGQGFVTPDQFGSTCSSAHLTAAP